MARSSERFGEDERNSSNEAKPQETEKLFELLIESAIDYAIYAMDLQRPSTKWKLRFPKDAPKTTVGTSEKTARAFTRPA
jgi:hypothetical protein